jgi:hypothetical protein
MRTHARALDGSSDEHGHELDEIPVGGFQRFFPRLDAGKVQRAVALTGDVDRRTDEASYVRLSLLRFAEEWDAGEGIQCQRTVGGDCEAADAGGNLPGRIVFVRSVALVEASCTAPSSMPRSLQPSSSVALICSSLLEFWAATK